MSRFQAMARWITGDRIIVGDRIIAGTLEVRDGKISNIFEGAGAPHGARPIDARGSVIMPGLVDTHAHINEPGRTDWEGFESATRAAAAGGITTIIDMPLNSIPPTTSVSALGEKVSAAEGQCWIDYGFWGGLVPGNGGELRALVQAGVMGFKCFLIDSGVPEFPPVNFGHLMEWMPAIAKSGLPLIVHAELESPLKESLSGSAKDYSYFLQSRPKLWENDAVSMMIDLAGKTGCRVHIVHLSSAEAVALIREARGKGIQITSETCPHYLVLAAETIGAGATQFKCCPPVRESANKERIWQGLLASDIDFVVSDHSPCPPSMKLMQEGDFVRAWGGISSLQFGLPLVWSELKRRGGDLAFLAKILSTRAAGFVSLGGVKGEISIGSDADLVIWSPEKSQMIGAGAPIYHRHKITPYEGMTVNGVVEMTILRGQVVFGRNGFSSRPRGQRLVPTRKRRN